MLIFKEILSHAGVSPLAEKIARRRTAAFGHIARLADNVPARLALRCQIIASLGPLPNKNWKRCPGRPRNIWLDLVRQQFFVVMMLERRYGRRWLRGPDDGSSVRHTNLLYKHNKTTQTFPTPADLNSQSFESFAIDTNLVILEKVIKTEKW